MSKHINLTVISYSAEGDLFDDRAKYPYYFRTVGENRQYEHLYVELFEELNWHRVAAFTEEGRKYTEYISQLQIFMKGKGIDLSNRKFSKHFEPAKIRSVSVCMCDKLRLKVQKCIAKAINSVYLFFFSNKKNIICSHC